MRRTAAALIICMLFTGLLYAAPSVSVCLVDESGCLPEFDTSVFDHIQLKGELLSIVRERELSKKTDELGKALHEAWKSEDPDKISSAQKEYETVSVGMDMNTVADVRFVSDRSSADMLIIAEVLQSDVFYTHTIDVVVGVTSSRVYEATSDTSSFPIDSISSLNGVFGYEGYVARMEEEKEVSFDFAPELVIPLAVEDYSLEKNRFYTCMAISLVSFGARVVCRFFDSQVLTYIADGGIAVSLVFTGSALWRYYKAVRPK